jgi:hypothetical protein
MWGFYYSLESDIFDKPNDREVDFFSQKLNHDHFRKNISADCAKYPSSKDISRIMNSSDNARKSSNKTYDNGSENDSRITSKIE